MSDVSCRISLPYVLLLVSGAGFLIGCQSTGDFDSLNPYDRTRAIVIRAEAGDASAIHRLVALLDDEDSAVRMYAIVALERLCGTTRGYRYYDNQTNRAAAVARWREAVQNGEIVIRSAPDARQIPAAPAGSNEGNAEDTQTQTPGDSARS